jgi:hypothetical protein
MGSKAGSVVGLIAFNRPTTITACYHSDSSIQEKRKGLFELEPGQASLIAEIAEPADAETVIEKNIITASGKPGSVDKGELEERGVRLAVQPANPSARGLSATGLHTNHSIC